ncbi:MAG: hypothetical protein PHY85_04155 [Bacteroidales bacterium]|nr:hypothetical protein [Bacteroidales bacterium]
MQLKTALFFLSLCYFSFVSSQKTVIFNYGTLLKTDKEQKTFADSMEIKAFVDAKIVVFQKMGYEAVKATQLERNSDTMNFLFLSGSPYIFKLDNLNIKDSTVLMIPPKLRSNLLVNANYDDFYNNIDDILQYYENRGYPFASFSVDSLFFDQNLVLIDMIFDKGIKYKYDSIVVKGDVRISDDFLRRFFNFKKRSDYSEKQIKQSSKLARQLPFMIMNDPPQVLFVEDEAYVFLFLKKRKNHSFDGIVGFVPPPDGESGIQLTGDISLKLNNLFQQGEILNFDWRAYDVGSQDLKIVFDYPFLFSSPFGTNLNFKLNKKDTSFINTYYNFGINYYFSGFDYLKGFYESTVSNTYAGVEQSPTGFRSSKVSSYGLEYSQNRLNDVILPTSGYSLKTSLAAGSLVRDKNPLLVSEENQKVNQYVLQIYSPFYVPLYKRFIFHAGIQGVCMMAVDLYENEMLRFGGFNSLKGFEEDGISASTYFMATTELRYMIESYSYFSVFWNGAFYEKKGVQSYTRDTPWGLGLGFAFNTPAGIFSINYAMGKQFNNPFDLKGAKVHFGISGKF